MNRRLSPNDLTLDERIDLLEDAQEHLEQAIDRIREAVRGTNLEPRTDAYLLPTLIMSLNEDHEYLGKQTNIAELIYALIHGED